MQVDHRTVYQLLEAFGGQVFDPHRDTLKIKLSSGYNSYGAKWEKLKEIKKIEVDERGNAWFNDAGLDPDRTLAIWVTKEPRDALYYAFSPEFRDADPDDPDDDERMADEFGDEWEEFKEAWKRPFSKVTRVALAGAVPVVDDGDGGYLFVKPVLQQGHHELR